MFMKKKLASLLLGTAASIAAIPALQAAPVTIQFNGYNPNGSYNPDYNNINGMLINQDTKVTAKLTVDESALQTTAYNGAGQFSVTYDNGNDSRTFSFSDVKLSLRNDVWSGNAQRDADIVIVEAANPQTAGLQSAQADLFLPTNTFNSTDTLSSLLTVLPSLPLKADRFYTSDSKVNFPTLLGATGELFNGLSEIDTVTVPEPASLALGAGVAVGALAMRRRREVVGHSI